MASTDNTKHQVEPPADRAFIHEAYFLAWPGCNPLSWLTNAETNDSDGERIESEVEACEASGVSGTTFRPRVRVERPLVPVERKAA